MRSIRTILIFFYCAAIFLLLDFTYSRFFHFDADERKFRVSNAYYHHDLMPNYTGYSIWGETRYLIHTNSLGFKDTTIREVTKAPDARRIIVIGDSFTEALGVEFDKSFAGLLFHAGQALDKKVEFLNAGVGSYSPSLYYRKIKHLINAGVRFDEVVVFSDTSDVHDEATSYFCFDDDPDYKSYCAKETRRRTQERKEKHLR